jgi:hypothetical protein
MKLTHEFLSSASLVEERMMGIVAPSYVESQKSAQLRGATKVAAAAALSAAAGPLQAAAPAAAAGLRAARLNTLLDTAAKGRLHGRCKEDRSPGKGTAAQ